MNSTRRKYFFDPEQPVPAAPRPVPEPDPVVVDRPGRDLVTLAVGTGRIGGPRRYGAGKRPARGNGGRWLS